MPFDVEIESSSNDGDGPPANALFVELGREIALGIARRQVEDKTAQFLDTIQKLNEKFGKQQQQQSK